MKNLTIFFSLAMVCSACNKEINDIKPLTQIDSQGQLSSVSGIVQATTGNYTMISASTGATAVNSIDLAMHDIDESRGNNIKLQNWALPSQFTDAFFFQNSLSPVAGYGPVLYRGAYQIITSANLTLEGIASFKASTFSSLTPSDQNKVLYAEGENHFLRALIYFNLVNVFGKPYYQSTASDLAVAIKTSSSATDLPAASSVKAIYSFIISDLQTAAQLMKAPVAKTNAFASTAAAWALLSRVYLYMGGSVVNPDPVFNQLSVTYADSVINQTNGAYDLLQSTAYANMFGNDSQGQLGRSSFSSNTEIIFAKDNATDGTTIGILYHFFPDANLGAIFLPSSDLLAQFAPGDLRGTFVATNNSTGYVETTKWLCLNNGGIVFCPTIFLRLGEIYLNRAEACAKINNIAQARADLKVIHVRAGLPGTDIDNLADAQVLAAVLKERRLELAFEGQNSFDYFRNGLSMTRPAADFNGSVYTVQPTDATVVFPVPNF